MFSSIYKNKTVLVTGHTGFKGAWLSFWLNNLGANVTGLSIGIPTEPSLFDALKLNALVNDLRGDIADTELIAQTISSLKPDFVFHLAAQPIVKKSYDDPVETFRTNVLGTMNVLNSLTQFSKPCSSVVVTSDKCYENQEWTWGYRENDVLGGKDPYSASKAAAEVAFRAMHQSFFRTGSPVAIASARAGNVIGGGDWAPNRLIPDAMRAWALDKPVKVRNPDSTRPWQHVLEPLSGYLRLGQALAEESSRKPHGESFNFGPSASQNVPVLELLERFCQAWKNFGKARTIDLEPDSAFHESSLLKLNCDKAQHSLGWRPSLNIDETIEFTSSWYMDFYHGSNKTMRQFTGMQIQEFQKCAIRKGNTWAE